MQFTWLYENRKLLVWVLLFCLLGWVFYQIKEVTTLLFLSYLISILLDPVVTQFSNVGISRGTSVIIIGVLFFGGAIILILFALPVVLDEYTNLLNAMPGYLQGVGEKAAKIFQDHPLLKNALGFDTEGFNGEIGSVQLTNKLQAMVSSLGVEQLKSFAQAIGDTVFKGYSFTLTVFNLFLLPLFVYYITKDLKVIHRFIAGFMSPTMADTVKKISNEILLHVYAFFKGQLTVSGVMTVLYIIGLYLVSLPWALIVGILAGVLNIVPYLGIGLGIILSTVITLMTNPSLWQLLLVWSVFVVVQIIEGFVLTPKIVGKSVGIHPLGVMLALVIGGQLFGLLGLVLAIPGAASLRVLFRQLMKMLEQSEGNQAVA